MAGAEAQLLEAVHAALTDILEPPELWTIHRGHLHDSLGDVGNVAGVDPVEGSPGQANQLILEPQVLVQVFLKWEKVVDNQRVVDPAPIMDLADLFRIEIQTRQTGVTPEHWYLGLERLWYPPDPTGQTTRFHAIVKSRGENNAVVLDETGP